MAMLNNQRVIGTCINCSWIDDHPPRGAVVNCTISALVAARLILATGLPSDAAPGRAIG